MASPSSQISDVITPLKSAVPPHIYDRAHRDLSLREASYVSEINLLHRKITNMTNDNSIAQKELNYLKREHGTLLFQKDELTSDLAESRFELNRLRGENTGLKEKCAVLEEEKVRMSGLKEEFRVLEKEVIGLRDENVKLSGLKEMVVSLESEFKGLEEEVVRLREENKAKSEKAAAAKAELEGCKVELREVTRVERKLVDELEKIKGEKIELKTKYDKVKWDYESVMAAAREKFRGFERRIVTLEGHVNVLKEAINQPGEQRVSDNGQEHLESLGSDVQVEEHVVGCQSICRTTPMEENSTSPVPCQQDVKNERQSLGAVAKPEELLKDHLVHDTTPVNEKTVSSKPFFGQSSSAATPIYISDSDDNGVSEKLKRKLVFANTPLKKPFIALKQCDRKLEGVQLGKPCSETGDSPDDTEAESGSSTKLWEYEADMVQDLEKHTLTCMNAVCALYRKHISLSGSSAAPVSNYEVFNSFYALRGLVLGKFLVADDPNGGLKRTVAELEMYDPKGADKCKTIAIYHSKKLFELYQSKEDPHFAPPN